MKPTASLRKGILALSILLGLTFLLQIPLSAIAGASTKPIYNPDKPEVLYDKNLYAESAVLIEQHSGRVLYDMKGSQKMQPASITKVMTLLLALENAKLNDLVVVGNEINQIPGDSSRCGLIQGERVTLESLLYGLMLKSGNDAAMTIAVHVAGSVDAFVEMMNEKAKELGCQNTRFVNPHGYEDKNHYTTALDFAMITRAGMENALFREIAGTSSYTIPKNNKRTQALTLKSTSPFVPGNSGLAHYYPYGTGIKTGYFSAAQHTFVGSASKDGVDLIAVILKTTKEGKWIDATRLMDYGFAVCQSVSLEELYNTSPVALPVTSAGGTGTNLVLKLDDKGRAFRFADSAEHLSKMRSGFSGFYVYNGPSTVSGAISAGEIVCTLSFYPQEGNAPLTFNLLASNDVGLINIPASSYTPSPSLIPDVGTYS